MTWSKDAEVDKLIDEAIQTTDPQQRYEKYATAQRKIMDVFPTIPVFEAPEKRAYQASYISWQPAELVKAGKPVLAVLGYLNYMRNIEYK